MPRTPKPNLKRQIPQVMAGHSSKVVLKLPFALVDMKTEAVVEEFLPTTVDGLKHFISDDKCGQLHKHLQRLHVNSAVCVAYLMAHDGIDLTKTGVGGLSPLEGALWFDRGSIGQMLLRRDECSDTVAAVLVKYVEIWLLREQQQSHIQMLLLLIGHLKLDRARDVDAFKALFNYSLTGRDKPLLKALVDDKHFGVIDCVGGEFVRKMMDMPMPEILQQFLENAAKADFYVEDVKVAQQLSKIHDGRIAGNVLMIASYYGNDGILKVLLKHPSTNLSAKSPEGKTAMQYALDCEDKTCAKLIAAASPDTVDRLECKACMDGQVSRVLQPCGHAYLCGNCAAPEIGAECDICREKVEAVMKFYLA